MVSQRLFPLLLLCAALAAFGCAEEATETAVAGAPVAADSAVREVGFVDVTAEAGIDFVHVSGAAGDFLLPEIMSGGGGVFDYDNDGYFDVYLVQSGHINQPDPSVANALYRNNGNGTFTNVTAEADVADAGYGMGCAAGDYTNDGFIDLYVTNLGANVLYRNNGNGTFTNVTSQADVGDPGWSTSAAFVDVDHDGWLDLFVVNYIDWSDAPAFTQRECHSMTGVRDYCSPLAYNAPALDTLYRNRGNGTFDNVSASSNIHRKPGTGLGVVCSDLNMDGLIDIYVANDQMPSFAWINQGGLTFQERAVPLGIAVDEHGKSQAGMGVDVADINNTGRPDIFKVHLHRETHILYINHGRYFDDATTHWRLAVTRSNTGFGAAIFDYDLDGLFDLFIANGRVMLPPGTPEGSGENMYAERNQLLRQFPAGRFEDVTDQTGTALDLIENSRAAAFGDIDNDGDIDILVVNNDGRARLLCNDVDRKGNFLTVRVLDENGRDAFGARLVVSFGGIERAYEVKAAFSYCATNDPRVHIGLGDATEVDRIEVRWPDGARESYGPFEANQFVEIGSR